MGMLSLAGGVAGAPCPERARLGAPTAAPRPRASSAARGPCFRPRLAIHAHIPAAPSYSSMYYDEDGDLAHEFYEETIVTKNGRKRAKLKRIHKNLIPQGIVKLEHPRIHVDFPVIICEV
ncbi:tumor suppressor candidate 2 isoform X1 [Numida meleagris]|uniref:tumor suppressor candidate 2 isoform X1 n=1 Tax=Numida meleagris TaxID=8996 RepID=UPI000B3DA51D|nr:tumor suppressor candidate 2 isoform X1 [Numida meleagris]